MRSPPRTPGQGQGPRVRVVVDTLGRAAGDQGGSYIPGGADQLAIWVWPAQPFQEFALGRGDEGQVLVKVIARAAVLESAHLQADLAEADLSSARLAAADCSSGNFRGAVLTKSDCTSTNFTSARLVGANLAGAADLHTGPGLAIPGAVAPERDDLCRPGFSLAGRRGCRRLGGIAAVPRG
jgi:hypothetical protein